MTTKHGLGKFVRTFLYLQSLPCLPYFFVKLPSSTLNLATNPGIFNAAQS